MKKIARRQRVEVTMQKNEKKREKKRKEKEDLKALQKKHKTRHMSLEKMETLFPNSNNKTIVIRRIPMDVKIAFDRKCNKGGCSVSGKIRQLLWEFTNNKIDDYQMTTKLGNFESTRGKTMNISVSCIPDPLFDKFTDWCLARGIGFSWKIRQLMTAHVKGIV